MEPTKAAGGKWGAPSLVELQQGIADPEGIAVVAGKKTFVEEGQKKSLFASAVVVRPEA